ncbi:MAG: leucine-rich repeat protein, partial [Eubacterium sp.]|nr:leucine-rich repeat protein [Eubacterium sp.]
VTKTMIRSVLNGRSVVIMAVFLLLYTALPAYAQQVRAASEKTRSESAEELKADEKWKEEEPEAETGVVSGTEQGVYTDSQGVIYSLDGNGCYVSGYTEGLLSAVAIPKELQTEDSSYVVKGIQKQAFAKCSRLKKIEIPNSVNDIGKGTFSGCSNLASISVVPAEYSLKANEKASTVGIRINSVLFGEAKEVRLLLRKEQVTQAAAQKAAEQIVLSVQADSSGDGTRYAVPEQIEFDADAVKALARCGKDLKVRLTDTDGEKYYVTMDKKNLKQISGSWRLKLRKQKTDRTTGNLKADLQKAYKKNGISEKKTLIYQMTLTGGEKASAEIVLPVKQLRAMQAGSEIYVYRYSKSKRDFLTVLYHPAVVSKQGNVRLSLDKGGVYILSVKPFQYLCRKLTNTWITEAGSTYYLDQNGQPVCGWKKLGQDYYYFDRENGKQAAGRIVDGIRLTKSGQAVATNANVQKIQTMIKARNIVLQITKPEDTLEEKIRKCFLWVFQFPYKQYRRLNPIYRQEGWEVIFANDIFDRQQGCCVSEASATAFLFHECGCETVYVATDTGHAWVELNGRVYDPLFAEARGFDNYYNRPYEGYGMYAVVKHKI